MCGREKRGWKNTPAELASPRLLRASEKKANLLAARHQGH